VRVAGITSRLDACNNEGNVDLNSLMSTMTWKKKKIRPGFKIGFTTHSGGFSVQLSPAACSSSTDGLDDSIIRSVFTFVIQSEEHRLGKIIDSLATTSDRSQHHNTPRSLISLSKASFSRLIPAKYLCSSQELLYTIWYTRTARPGLELL
jgi:hypothetical protein